MSWIISNVDYHINTFFSTLKVNFQNREASGVWEQINNVVTSQVSFAAVLMARTPPQVTSDEPSGTFHSTKLTNDIDTSISQTIRMRRRGRFYSVFWWASFATITAL